MQKHWMTSEGFVAGLERIEKAVRANNAFFCSGRFSEGDPLLAYKADLICHRQMPSFDGIRCCMTATEARQLKLG